METFWKQEESKLKENYKILSQKLQFSVIVKM